jgi:uncharacterized protein (TIGR00290 family)
MTAPETRKNRTILAWSSGKDSAWALDGLRREGTHEIVSLLTTFNEAFDRVAMHSTRAKLVEAQAEAAGVPLWSVPLPWPCSNEQYEERMRKAVDRAKQEGVTHMAFGDLFLEDIRAYREEQLSGTGITPLFPVWASREATPALAREMVASGLKAIITSVDPKQLDPCFTGRFYDERLLADLPGGVDPCGENGEFHTFCFDGPVFGRPLDVKKGEVVERDGFWYADVLPG